MSLLAQTYLTMRVLVLCVLSVFVLLPDSAKAHTENYIEVSQDLPGHSDTESGATEFGGHCHPALDCSVQAILHIDIQEQRVGLSKQARRTPVCSQRCGPPFGFDPPPPRYLV